MTAVACNLTSPDLICVLGSLCRAMANRTIEGVLWTHYYNMLPLTSMVCDCRTVTLKLNLRPWFGLAWLCVPLALL